jgi:hypothetical protein
VEDFSIGTMGIFAPALTTRLLLKKIKEIPPAIPR